MNLYVVIILVFFSVGVIAKQCYDLHKIKQKQLKEYKDVCSRLEKQNKSMR